METLRHWSVRHAGALARVYAGFARIAPRLGGALRLIGEARSERLMRPVERAAKQLFFDCQMCGQCALSESGMACPTNCAKTMRNGPCGGVSAAGACEVKPCDALRLGRGDGGAEANFTPDCPHKRQRSRLSTSG